MKFCPECENILYSTEKQFYCKACKKYYDLEESNAISLSTNLNQSSKLNEKVVVKRLDNNDILKLNKSNNLNYIQFFPYEQFRKTQEKIIKQIEDSGRNRKIILLSAPNGTGKTVMALSALLPIAMEKDLKVLYLCRTHAQNSRVIKEFVKISRFHTTNNLTFKLSGISLRGRNEMCLNKTLLSLKLNPKESMSVCTDLRKNKNCVHFLNLLKKKDSVDKPILIAPDFFKKPIDAEDLIKYCKEKRLCPYFLSKYLLTDMRLVVCNYQWVFNPFIRESFLKFIGKELQNCILVIDECHNIIDVATEINSERITPYSLRLCLKDLEMYNSPRKMQSFVNLLLNHLDKKKKKITVEEEKIDPGVFLEIIYQKLGFSDLNAFNNFNNDLHDFSVSIHEERIANGEISRDFVGALAEFWLKWIDVHFQDNYFFCYTIKRRKERKVISMEIVALDPRDIVLPILKNCYTCLNLSGTVNPYVFNNLMGFKDCGKSYKGIIANSPFEKKNVKALITEGVDTRRENRTRNMFEKMVERINEVLISTLGNIGIFCASYKILQGLLEHGIEKVVKKNNKKFFAEEPGLSASENAVLVEDFKSMASYGGAVLLGVCGGRNSEGEDYPGNQMNSVIIAGVPYHLPTPRVNAKIEYYDKVFQKQGWNFAYLYPAIQRANQASGRPIRKISDKGAIVFMDSRFKQKYNWISEWIRNEIEIVPDKKNAIIQQLYPFWNQKQF